METEVVVFNCRLRVVLDEAMAEELRSVGVDPLAAAREDAADYEIGELLYGGAVCPTDCEMIARELPAHSVVIKHAEVISDKEPCEG